MCIVKICAERDCWDHICMYDINFMCILFFPLLTCTQCQERKLS